MRGKGRMTPISVDAKDTRHPPSQHVPAGDTVSTRNLVFIFGPFFY